MDRSRVVLKLSGERLRGTTGQTFDQAVFDGIVDGVKKARELNPEVEIAIMVGGGNIVRGAEMQGMNRDRADQAGMLATGINALILTDALERAGVPHRMFSAVDMREFAPTYNRQVVASKLDRGYIVVLAAGMGKTRFTTDTAAAQMAAELEAGLLLKGTHSYDGIYTADPGTDPAAEKIPDITYDDVIALKLRVMDLTSITHCRDNGLLVRIFHQNGPDSLAAALTGEPVGSLIHP